MRRPERDQQPRTSRNALVAPAQLVAVERDSGARDGEEPNISVPRAQRRQFVRRVLSYRGFQVEEWQIPPISGAVTVSSGKGVVDLIAVLGPGLQYWNGAERVDAASGSVYQIDGVHRLRFRALLASRVMVIALPVDLAQQEPVLARRAAPLARTMTRLLEALIAVSGQALDAEPSRRDAPARAGLALAEAVIAEMLTSERQLPLRERIVQYIELHLEDPLLTPNSIAAALGVSVRWTHKSFEREQETLSRYIRRCRLERLAARLETDFADLLNAGVWVPSVQMLADRSGFRNRDSLTRAFKGQFGMTIGRYAADAAARRAQAPPAGR